MVALIDQTMEPFIADEAEALIAQTAVRNLRAVAEAGVDIKVAVDGKADVIVPLPARAVSIILEVLEAMANRTPVSLVPHDAELSTQQAADYLNVSRPYLIKQIDAGFLPCRMVGTHRRIRFADLVDYERKSREDQGRAMAEVISEARRLNLE